MGEMEYVFVAGDFNQNTWICDSGASTHMGNVCEGMTEVEEIDEPVKVGNGNVMRAVRKGTIRLRAIQVDDTTRDIALQDYKYIGI